MRLRTGRGRERSERAATPASAGPHPAPSPAPPSPVASVAFDRTPTLLHPSLTRVLVAIRDLPLHQEVLDFAVRDGRIDVVGTTTDAADLAAVLRQAPVDAVVCCAEVAGAGPEGTWRAPSGVAESERPRLYVVGQELTVPILRRAIALGADGAFRWPEERHALADRLRRKPVNKAPAGGARGSVVAVHGARGGSGTTFVACQLAAALAARGDPTSLMDAGLAFSDVTAALGVPMDRELRTISDLIPVAEEVSTEHLAQVLHQHAAGFSALLGPVTGSVEGAVEEALVRSALSSLKESYGAVVVHTPRSIDAATREALHLADVILLVTTLDLFSLYGAKRVVQRMGTGNSERVHLVVNKAARSSIGVGDVERVLGIAPIARVRFDPAVPRAQERGELLRPRSGRAARDVDRLAGWLRDQVPFAATEVS